MDEAVTPGADFIGGHSECRAVIWENRSPAPILRVELVFYEIVLDVC
jgi:hypothetical protein